MVTHLIPLAMVCPGEEVKIVSLRAGRGLAQRLADMGLVRGRTIKVVSSHMPGPLMIGMRGSRLVLGCGVAQKIMVERRENA